MQPAGATFSSLARKRTRIRLESGPTFPRYGPSRRSLFRQRTAEISLLFHEAQSRASSRKVVANGRNYFLPVTYSRTNKLRSRRVVARQIAVIRERASFFFHSKFTVSLFTDGSTRSLQADSRKG